MSTLQAPPRRQPPVEDGSGAPAIDRVVAMARRRMRLNRALAVAGPALLVAGVAASLWLVVGRFVLLPDLDVVVVAGAVGLASVAVVAAAAVRIPSTWAAWAADRWLQTRDAFATAVELRDGRRSSLAHDQIAAAEALAAGVTGWPQGPNVPGRRLMVGAATVLAAVGLAAAPNPQDDVRERRSAEEALVTAEAEQLREEADELREAGDPDQDALADQLDTLADQLETGDLDDALDELADARAQLEQQLAEDLASQRTALSGLRQELSREPLADGDSVREQLEQLAEEAGAGQHDGGQDLADRLQALADALQSGQPQVADALSRAAGAISSGDPSDAEQALGEASDAVGDALDQLADQEAAQDAAGAVDQAQGRLGEAQDQLDRGETPDALQPGQGEGQGQGEGEGQGEGQGQGQGGAGGGGGGGNPTGDQGQGGGNDGGGTPNAGTPGRLDLETVYDPPGADVDGEDVNVRGNDDGTGDSDTVGSGEGQGTRTDALVPYLDVLTDYQERATRTIERPGFPVELRDLVRDYFDQIGRTQ